MSIIKCPECGNPVSTMAGTCPRCGVKIHDNLEQCPRCGTYYLGKEAHCPYCNYSRDEENTASAHCETQDLAQTQPSESPSASGLPADNTPQKESRKSPVAAFLRGIGILAGIALSGYGGYQGYLYYTDYTRRMEEKQRFEELAPLTNPTFYRQYIREFPNSIYVPEVEKRLKELLGEDLAWKKARQQNSKEALIAFMEQYPLSLHSRMCNRLMDSIDWAHADSIGTEEAMDHYLAQHPEGAYTEPAVETKKKIDRQKTSPQENEAVSAIVKNFFAALPTMELSKLQEAIAEPMYHFCNTPEATAKQVLRTLRNKRTKDVDELLMIAETPMNTTRIKLPDGTTGYQSICMLEEITRWKNKKKKDTSVNYKATCLLNSRHQLVSVQLDADTGQ